MNRVMPGTTVARGAGQTPQALLGPMFLAGGLTLSQVASLTGLEPYAIQNWVKRGFVSPPRSKRYTCRQFGRIALINMLKEALRLEGITRLLSYVNGHLDDESDDLIDDFELYCAAVGMLDRLEEGVPMRPEMLGAWSAEALKEYAQAEPDARARVGRALEIIFTAHAAARLKARAEEMLEGLPME